MASKPSTVSVRDYLRILFRRKLLLFLPVCLGALAVVPLWMVIPPKYQAVTLVVRKDLSSMNPGSASTLSRPSVDALRTEILTTTNLDSIINKAKLVVPSDLASKQAKYLELRRAISIRIIPKDRGEDFIQITVISPASRDAFMIANAVAEDYIEQSIRVGQKDLQRTVEHYQAMADEANKGLKEAEAKLNKFYREHWTELPEVKRGILDTINRLKIEEGSRAMLMTEAEERLVEVNRLLDEMEKAHKNGEEGPRPPSMEELEREVTQLKAAIQNALIRYTEKHPDVVRLRELLADRETKIAELRKSASGGDDLSGVNFGQLVAERRNLEMTIAGQKAVLLGLRSNIKANEEAIKEVIVKEKDYNDWTRDRDAEAERLKDATKHLNEARNRLAAMISDYGIRVEMKDAASEPKLPYQGESLQVALAAIGAGLAVGLLLLFLAEFSDHSLRGMEDAAGFLNIPVLGSLSVIVTPETLARRRTRAFWLLAAIIVVPLLLAVALVIWDAVSPGVVDRLYDRLRAFGQAAR